MGGELEDRGGSATLMKRSGESMRKTPRLARNKFGSRIRSHAKKHEKRGGGKEKPCLIRKLKKW